jgi:hypothetical protein
MLLALLAKSSLHISLQSIWYYTYIYSKVELYGVASNILIFQIKFYVFLLLDLLHVTPFSALLI